MVHKYLSTFPFVHRIEHYAPLVTKFSTPRRISTTKHQSQSKQSCGSKHIAENIAFLGCLTKPPWRLVFCGECRLCTALYICCA